MLFNNNMIHSEFEIRFNIESSRKNKICYGTSDPIKMKRKKESFLNENTTTDSVRLMQHNNNNRKIFHLVSGEDYYLTKQKKRYIKINVCVKCILYFAVE